MLTRSHERIKIRRADRSTCVCFNPSRRRRHSPAALVVEEQDEVEFLFGFVLHLLSNAEHVHGGHGDGHPVVLAAHSRHVGVDDLHKPGGGGGGGGSHDTCKCKRTFMHRLAGAYGDSAYTHRKRMHTRFFICPLIEIECVHSERLPPRGKKWKLWAFLHIAVCWKANRTAVVKLSLHPGGQECLN